MIGPMIQVFFDDTDGPHAEDLTIILRGTPNQPEPIAMHAISPHASVIITDLFLLVIREALMRGLVDDGKATSHIEHILE